jgi:hypothetical protein
MKLFKWRVKLAQAAYDRGYAHGVEAGKIEKHNDILSLLNHSLESIDWTREEPIQVRDIIPLVKEHKTKKDTWEDFRSK